MWKVRLFLLLSCVLLVRSRSAHAAKRTVPIMRMDAHAEAPAHAPAGSGAPTLEQASKVHGSASAPAPSTGKMVHHSPGSKYNVQENYVMGPDGEKYALPLPQTGLPTKKLSPIVDQPYLGGGNRLPANSLAKDAARPTGTATAKQTAGNKLVATVIGGRLPAVTGVSTSAIPAMPRTESSHSDKADLADGPESTASQTPMRYHWGGAVLPNPKVFLIFYGSWLCNNYANQKCASDYGTPSIIRDAVIGLSGSPWLNILSSYSDGAGSKIANTLQFGDDTFVSEGDPCWKGTTLSDSDVFDIVQCVLDKKLLPYADSSMYLVLSSGEVKETSGFCSSYCGWHAHDNWGPPLIGKNIRYGFVGSPNLCPRGCMKQRETSPNSIPEADGMISIIAHEIVEVITDPDANAWFDDNGAENADKCSWKYGDTQTSGNAKYNAELPCNHEKCSEWGKNNKRKYLIQQNWVHEVNGGYCATSH
eukprot:jgi/Botrbrau1/3290/Bobra.174_1s0054.2